MREIEGGRNSSLHIFLLLLSRSSGKREKTDSQADYEMKWKVVLERPSLSLSLSLSGCLRRVGGPPFLTGKVVVEEEEESPSLLLLAAPPERGRKKKFFPDRKWQFPPFRSISAKMKMGEEGEARSRTFPLL